MISEILGEKMTDLGKRRFFFFFFFLMPCKREVGLKLGFCCAF
jgi:hypothetical protein